MFYTYLYLRDYGSPSYVGKGKGNRVFDHSNHRVKPPEDKDFIITQSFESEEDAFFAEKFLIALYGRKDNGTGILRNLTDGGDGTSGLKHSSESIERIRKGHLGQPAWNKGLVGVYKTSEETKEKQRQSLLGRTFSEESIEKMRVAQLGKKRSDEARKHISEGHMGQPAWNKGVSPSEETKEKMRSNMNAAYASGERTPPMLGKNHTVETRLKIGAKSKGRKDSEETKIRRSEAAKRSWENGRRENRRST